MVLFMSEYDRYTIYIGMLWVLYVLLFVGGMCIVCTTNLITLYSSAYIQTHVITYTRKFYFFLKYYMYLSSSMLLRCAYTYVYTLLDKGILELLGPYGCIQNILKYTKKTTDAAGIRIYQNTGFVLCTIIISVLYIISI